jgi:hypothetical protein
MLSLTLWATLVLTPAMRAARAMPTPSASSARTAASLSAILIKKFFCLEMDTELRHSSYLSFYLSAETPKTVDASFMAALGGPRDKKARWRGAIGKQ